MNQTLASRRTFCNKGKNNLHIGLHILSAIGCNFPKQKNNFVFYKLCKK